MAYGLYKVKLKLLKGNSLNNVIILEHILSGSGVKTYYV